MNKILFYFSIAVAISACGGSSSSDTPQNEEPVSAYLTYMKTSYTELFGENAQDQVAQNRNVPSRMEAFPAASAFEDAADTSTSNAQFSAHSETNVQILGVDEASPVKFDGDHLLVQSQTHFYISEDNQEGPRVLNFPQDTLQGLTEENTALHFTPDSEYSYKGLLRYGNYAALVGHKTSWYPYVNTIDLAPTIYCRGCNTERIEPEVIIYTWRYTQDGQALPPQTETITIEGSFNQVRLIEDKLYLVSQHSPTIDDLIYQPTTVEEMDSNQRIIESLELEDVSPYIAVNGSRDTLIRNSCTLPENNEDFRYNPQVISLTQIDITNPTDWQSACVVGDISGAFFSTENIYLSRWNWSDNESAFLKFSVNPDNGIRYEASGSVEGSVSYDSYYFGEVDGHLIYVNTVYDEQSWWNSDGRHQLSVFAQNGSELELVAQIPNEDQPEAIGKPGEQIYAVRIIDERAYIVTFDRIDPLYVIDLSQPTSPEILGELEIPGFSSYIHPINDDLLIGIGKNAVNYEGNTWFQGLNIRLFDVSDPTQPIALISLDYGRRGSSTNAAYDPHAFTFAYDEEAGLFRFALPMNLHGTLAEDDPEAHPNTYYPLDEAGLYQFEVTTHDSPQIAEVGRHLFSNEEGEPVYSGRAHSVIDGDSLYLIRNDILQVLEWGATVQEREFELNP